jgi:hypothetical protein
MADFVETNMNRTSVRELAVPVADVAAFDAIVQSVLDTNPFGCTDEAGEGGAVIPGVARNREYYTARVVYEDDEARIVGQVSLRSPTVAAFEANAAEVMANAALAAAMGGDAVRDAAKETYSCQLRCHDPSGEVYYVTFTRKNVRISSYQDDAIRTAVEAWADTVPALA